MVDITKYTKKKLNEIAEIERVKSKVVYPKGTILIQVSATKGQTLILKQDGPVESKYVCINPHKDIHPYYLFVTIGLEIDNFMKVYQTGLNLQVQTLENLELQIHEYETQKHIGEMMRLFDEIENYETEVHEGLINLKKDALDKMFV